eukprot:g25734.t1
MGDLCTNTPVSRPSCTDVFPNVVWLNRLERCQSDNLEYGFFFEFLFVVVSFRFQPPAILVTLTTFFR